MTSYAELSRELKLAYPLYLELRALGLDLRTIEDHQGEPSGYKIEIQVLRSLSEAHAERVRRRVEEVKPGLMRILMMGKGDEDLCAVRKEANAA